MTRFGWTMVLGAILLIGAALGAVWLSTHTRHAVTPQAASTVPLVQDPSTLSIYTNGEFGFSFFYPALDTLVDSYTATSSISASWRVGATATGTPIVRVTDPAGVVEIGLSTSKRELKACTTPAPAEKTLPAQKIGSTTFAVFSFAHVGTDNEQQVLSYRTLHDNACVAMEVIVPLAQASTTPVAALAPILQSFSFSRP